MQTVARLEALEDLDRRSAVRRRLHVESAIEDSGERVIIHDLSSTGMLVETSAPLARSDELQVELPQTGTATATVVWSTGNYFGCEFNHRISRAALSAALLRSTPGLSTRPALPRDSADEDLEGGEEAEDDRFPLAVRLGVILGATILLWALIFWSLGIL